MSELLLDNIFRLDDELPKEPACKGVYFRYTESTYYSGDKFVFQKQFSLLKRMSCPGCSKCYHMLDDAKQGIMELNDAMFEFDTKLNHNDIVTLQYVTDSTDWETGYVDEWHFKVVPVNQP